MNVWIKILRAVGPPLLAALLPASRITPIILAAVEAAEEHGNVPGGEKKVIALRRVDDGVAALNAAANQPTDPNAARLLASNAIDALVSTVNAWTTVAAVGGLPDVTAAAADTLPIVPPGGRR